MCVICETIYICGDKDSQTVQCNDTKSPTHQTRILTTNNPDVCNRPNCRNPNAIPAEYVAGARDTNDPNSTL